MKRKPRNPNEKLLNTKTLFRSLMQGMVIFAASFGTYYYMLLQNPDNASVARSMGLAIIMLANLFLVQVNSSETDFAIVSFKQLVKDKVMWAINIITVSGLLLILYTPLNGFLKLAPFSAGQVIAVICLSAVSVLWYEVVKLIKKVHHKTASNHSDKNKVC